MVSRVPPLDPQRRPPSEPFLRLADAAPPSRHRGVPADADSVKAPARPEAPAARTPATPAPRVDVSAAHRAKLAAERVAYENACAAMLQPADARWIFALRVAGALEGGKAALLTPPKRRELVAAAVVNGLREFDANLIIAVVQDSARRGELGDTAKAARAMAPSLAMVASNRLANQSVANGSNRSNRRTILVVLATLLAAGVCFAFMVRWLLAK